MSSALQAFVFMGKHYSDNLQSSKKNRKRSHFETDVWHIWKVDSQTIRWDFWSVSNQLGKFCMETVINDEEVLSLTHAKVYVFSDFVLCLGKVNQNPTSNTAWERQLDWFKDSSQYRTFGTIHGDPMEFEWNFPRIHFIAARPRSPKVHEQNGRT